MQTWELAVRCTHLLRRWWLLILIAGLASGATSIYLFKQRPPQYVARTTLMVGTNLRDPNPPENSANLSMSLASFYAEMARRTPVTGQIVEQLKLPFSADVLNEKLVSTRVIPQAQLIEIAVLDTNPDRASRIANAIGAELINFSPTSPDKLAEQRAFTKAQVADLEGKITETDDRIKELNATLRQLTSAGEIAEAQQRLQELETLKASDQATYNGLLTNLNDSAPNTLTVFEAATPPTTPVPQRTFPAIVLSALLGGIIGLGAAWLLDDMDDQWRRRRRPELVVGQAMLSEVETNWGDLTSGRALGTPRGKQCLALRAEILIGIAPQAHATLMITSAHASIQRSRLSSDMARLMAQSGQRVLLVDANLQSPSVATSFGVHGDSLQTLLNEPTHPLIQLVHATEQPNLVLLPGIPRDETTDLVPTLHWPKAIRSIEAAEEIELSIIDGPALLDGADGVLLAPHVGGIVLVIDPQHERCSETRQALQRLQDAGAPVVGCVMLVYAQPSLRDRVRRVLRRPATSASSTPR